MRVPLLLVAFLGFVGVGAAWLTRGSGSDQPLDVGLYYWHTPFSVSSDQAVSLQRMGVSTLYVRAGDFVQREGTCQLAEQQTWPSPVAQIPVVLVLRVSDPVSKLFDSDDPVRRKALAEGAETALKRASEAGVPVVGLQIDADCPTRLLPAYAKRLAELRADLDAGTTWRESYSFSATALPTWLDSPDARMLADAVDFLVPQFYEGRPFRTLDDIKPIGDLDAFPSGLRAAERLGTPMRVGIPAYGHALLFDENGMAVASYQGVGVGEAMRHPSLKPESNYGVGNDGRPTTRRRWIGEELAVLGSPKGRGPAFTVAYLLPTAVQVRKHLEILRRQRPRNCRGVILYRFPEAGETTSLPLQSLQAALGDEPLVPVIEAKIETGGNGAVRVRIENTGNVSSFTSPDALRLLVELDKPGLLEVSAGEFDEAVAGVYDRASGGFTPTGLSRARAVVFRRARIGPGESVRAGELKCASGGTVRDVSWKVMLPGGFDVLEGGMAVK